MMCDVFEPRKRRENTGRILRTINYKLVVSCNNTICNLFIVVRSLSALREFIVYLTYSNISISIKLYTMSFEVKLEFRTLIF